MVRRMSALAACALLAATLFAPTASAADAWSGRWSLLRYAAQKTGTSLAARQPEPDFSDEYVFVTKCEYERCLATVVEGPQPKNPTLPQPPQYTWDGTRWIHVYDWQWDCYMGEGVPKVWAPARSWAFYTPQPDGTMRGRWTTQIVSGPCVGTVEMPVAAFPVPR